MIQGPPEYNPSLHKSRREALMETMEDGDLVIVIGGKEHSRNSDVTFPFRQGSNMYYLTGFEEPDSVALIEKKQFTLIVPERNKDKEIWTGRRAGVEGAKNIYQATHAHTVEELDSVIQKACQLAKRVFIIEENSNPELMKRVSDLITFNSVDKEGGFTVINPTISGLRMVKTEDEIARLKIANAISSDAHKAVMKSCKRIEGSINECQIRAEIEKVFIENGAARLGYPSIVASGVNATILHYPSANAYAKPGDLVLIDAGAEYGYYTADITRTWPISGTFTQEQKAIYQIVYDAQEACFEALKPGITIAELHRISELVIAKGLVKLGIMEGVAEELIEQGKVKQFYPHTIGHYLGLDVHDACPKAWSKGGKEIPLEVGMVITVEPGIYIQEYDETVDAKWRGIGVRIEDNLLLTEGGSLNLTNAPRSIQEIEGFMAEI